MKFICPSCKAKYQIADEKIAGRSVRMKCRKCAHIIQVSRAPSEAPTEASASEAGAAKSSGARSAEAQAKRLAAEAPAAEAPAGERPARETTAKEPPSKHHAPPPRKPPPRSAATPAPRSRTSSPGGGAAPRVVAPRQRKEAPAQRAASGARTSMPGAPQRPSRVGSSALPAASKAPEHTREHVPEEIVASQTVAAEPEAEPRDSRQSVPATRSELSVPEPSPVPKQEVSPAAPEAPSPQGLAGAFSEAVAAPESTRVSRAPGAADEWFVGVGGAPVGPITLSDLRSKAATGEVSRASLVWRDGFEDWKRLDTFPELVAIIEEGLSNARASGLPPPPVDIDEPKPAREMGQAATVAKPSVAAPFEGELELPVRKKRSSGVLMWLVVVIAILFGITVGTLRPEIEAALFGEPDDEREAQLASAPAQAPVDPLAAGPRPEPVEQEAPDQPQDAGTAEEPGQALGTAKVSRKGQATSSEKEPAKTGGGLSGLQGLGGPSQKGPSAAPGSTNQKTRGEPLSASQVQRVVARYRSSVRRGCWQPALDTRDKDAPTTARVNVKITVAASGNVQGVSTSGDPRGYRGLANCIAARVRGWQFPSSSESTTVNVPFVFAGQ